MKLRHTPLLLIATALVAGPLLLFADAAGAGTSSSPAITYQTSRINAGTPNSTNVTKDPKTGAITSYGDSAITYTVPSPALNALGQSLYLQNCASCHGTEANGAVSYTHLTLPTKRIV